MSDRPVLLVTRKLPEAVEARADRDYDAILNADDSQYVAEALISSSANADAILTCSTERFSADVVERLDPRLRAIVTFSVGYEHIDIDAAKARGIIVTNTPDVLTNATADITLLCLLGAARRQRQCGPAVPARGVLVRRRRIDRALAWARARCRRRIQAEWLAE